MYNLLYKVTIRIYTIFVLKKLGFLRKADDSIVFSTIECFLFIVVKNVYLRHKKVCSIVKAGIWIFNMESCPLKMIIMKKILLGTLLLLLGCTEYSVVSYDKPSIDVSSYFYEVGYLINNYPRQNGLPKKGLVAYFTNKSGSSKQVRVLEVSSKEYGVLNRYDKKVSHLKNAENLYVKDLDYEKGNEARRKIEIDTITVKFEEENKIKVVQFYKDHSKKRQGFF